MAFRLRSAVKNVIQVLRQSMLTFSTAQYQMFNLPKFFAFIRTKLYALNLFLGTASKRPSSAECDLHSANRSSDVYKASKYHQSLKSSCKIKTLRTCYTQRTGNIVSSKVTEIPYRIHSHTYTYISAITYHVFRKSELNVFIASCCITFISI